jgi:hypothetical protein
MVSKADRDPRHHSQKMQVRLQEMMDRLREDIVKVEGLNLPRPLSTSARFQKSRDGAAG